MKRILFELCLGTLGLSAEGAGDSAEGPAAAADGAERSGAFTPVSAGRFRKELIREGTWVHPSRNFRLSVTRERMSRWVQKFRLMKKRGIRVPVPFGHSYDPKDNAGFVEDLFLEGNALFAILHIPRPEDAEKLGTTVKDVSISINPDFRDGEGRRYGEVIEHVALTTRPVVSGQSDFVPLELPDGSRAELWRFRPERLRPRSRGPEAEETRQAGAAAEPRPAALAEEAGATPARTGSEDEKPQALPLAEQRARTEAQPSARPGEAGSAEPEGKAPVGSADREASDGSAEVTVAVRSGPAEPRLTLERELARMRSAALERELDELTRAGRLTPAMREPVRRLLSLSEPVTLQLADGPLSVDVAAEVRAFLEAIPEHALIDLRERTLLEAPRPVGEMTDERAARLAEENRRLAKLQD